MWSAVHAPLVQEGWSTKSLVPAFRLIELRFLEVKFVPHPHVWGAEFGFNLRLKPSYVYPFKAAKLFCRDCGVNLYTYFDAANDVYDW